MILDRDKIYYFIFFWTISCITMLIELIYPKFLQFMQIYGFETTIIPISMLGISAGALYVFKKKISVNALFYLSICFASSIVAVPFLLFYFKSKFLAVILIAIPFFFSSSIITAGYSSFSPFLIYTSFSSGSAIGVLLIVYLLGPVSGENFLFLSGMVVAMNSLIIPGLLRKQKIYSAFITLLFFIILLTNIFTDSFNFIRIMPSHSGKSFVNYAGSERLKEKDAKLLFSRWSLISRVDLIKENLSIYDSLFGKDILNFRNKDVRDTFLDLKGKGEFYNLYYNNVIFTFIPYRDKIEWKIPPYTLLDRPSVLIIGPGGGVDIAVARYNNARDITAVEINPATVSLMQDQSVVPVSSYRFADVYLMDGRSFVELTKKKYDLIQLMFTELYVPFPNSLAFIENYLYTVEAFQAYLRVLNEDGIIFINKWIGNYNMPTELLRITTTSYEALKKEGINKPEDNIVIVGYFISGWKTNGGYVLIKKKPFTHEEINRIKESLGEPMYLLYSPEDRELNNPFAAFLRSNNVELFYQIAPMDISPTYDDRPYINQFDKKLIEHWRLLITLIMFSAFLLFYVFFNLKKSSYSKDIIYLFVATIFIAVGYMWVELIIVQKFNILLGSPVISMGIIMLSFFMASALGSTVVSNMGRKTRIFSLWMIPFVVYFLFLLLPEMTASLLDETRFYKILSGIATSFVSGFFLGMPFPVILDIMSKREGFEKIPLLVCFDGVFSVLAVGLVMLLSVIYGFNLLLFVSSILYLPGIILICLLLK